MIGIKLALLLAVAVAGALGGALPLRRGGDARAGRLLGWGNAFAAGVFLGVGLIHMLPDAHETWSGLGWDYPMAFLLATAAFVLMLLFEHVLLPESAHRVVHAPSMERFSEVDGSLGRLATYAVLTALCVHSFIEGLALGAQPVLANALVIFLAILAHKSTAGFALGVSLVRSSMPRRHAWRLLALFAAASPLGIAVGAFLDAGLAGGAQQNLQATFLALAAGTFAYVATLDILRDEFFEPGGRIGKWLCVTLGTGLMALLAVWV